MRICIYTYPRIKLNDFLYNDDTLSYLYYNRFFSSFYISLVIATQTLRVKNSINSRANVCTESRRKRLGWCDFCKDEALLHRVQDVILDKQRLVGFAGNCRVSIEGPFRCRSVNLARRNLCYTQDRQCLRDTTNESDLIILSIELRYSRDYNI